MNDVATEEELRDKANRVVAWVGLILHIAIAVFPFSASGLLAPLYGIALVYLGWAVALYGVIRWWRSAPKAVLLMPFAALVWWFAVMTVGGAVLGWTA